MRAKDGARSTEHAVLSASLQQEFAMPIRQRADAGPPDVLPAQQRRVLWLLIIAGSASVVLACLAGAILMVTLAAGAGIILLGLPLVWSRAIPMNPHERRAPLLAGAALLAAAAGIQTVIYRLGLGPVRAETFGMQAAGLMIFGALGLAIPASIARLARDITLRWREYTPTKGRPVLVDALIVGVAAGTVALLLLAAVTHWTALRWPEAVDGVVFLGAVMGGASVAYRRFSSPGMG